MENFLDELEKVVGQSGMVTEPEMLVPYLEEGRGLFQSKSPMVVLPSNTMQVSEVVQLCTQAKVGIVPQGGNTGRVGGAVASGEIILNLSRMNQIVDVDPFNYTISVEAGCVLQDVQREAEKHQRLFPLSLGAEGSCQIGGNLSTNAGGTAVLKFGNARELTLGLEVVLPNGEIWNGMRGLRKNNTGYDLKHLFIGAEGTLGIITAAVLKLFPLPARFLTTFVALRDLEALLEMLSLARSSSGDTLTTFEWIPRIALECASKHIEEIEDPFDTPHQQYALLEFSLSHGQQGLAEYWGQILEKAMEQGILMDAIIADSEKERRHLWKIREAIVTAQKLEGASIKNDVSVPLSKIPELIVRATEVVQSACPGIRPYPFGHIGDGNIHLNLTQPLNETPENFLARWTELTTLVNDIVQDLGGSFSAEHGVGRLKKGDLVQRVPEIEVKMMKQIKQLFDPEGIMNPKNLLNN